MTISALRDDKIVLEITQADSRVEIAGVDDFPSPIIYHVDIMRIFSLDIEYEGRELTSVSNIKSLD